MSDVNGEYMASDYVTRSVAKGEVHYSTFSLWDTFRAAHPLYTLMHTHRIPDFVKSMMRQYDYYGYLPVWQLWGQDNYCMIGNHSIPVIVDAVLKGVAGVDEEKAYEAVFNSSIVSHPNSPLKYGRNMDICRRIFRHNLFLLLWSRLLMIGVSHSWLSDWEKKRIIIIL